MPLSSEAVNLNTIVQQLQGHKQLKRLKKLIYYTSTGNWENDVNVLEQLNLEQLLENLYQANSTLDELSESLYQSVDTLNRQTVYSELANLVIAKIGLLYQDSADSTEVIMIKPAIKDSLQDSVLEKIVANLHKHQELARIKKLVFYLVKDQWESDINVINSYDFKGLIVKLRENYTNLNNLEKAFSDLVATLNRQHLYLAVSEAIIKELTKLYKNDEGETQLFSQTAMTKVVKAKEAEEKLSAPPQEKPPESNEQKTVVQKSKNAQSENEVSKKNLSYTSFDWRLDIMQYSNPLRVKILLFSVLYHQFQNNDKDWAKLKSCTLDDLLNKIRNRYQSLEEVEKKLNYLAEATAEPEINQQTASVIIKSLMSFYETI